MIWLYLGLDLTWRPLRLAECLDAVLTHWLGIEQHAMNAADACDHLHLIHPAGPAFQVAEIAKVCMQQSLIAKVCVGTCANRGPCLVRMLLTMLNMRHSRTACSPPQQPHCEASQCSPIRMIDLAGMNKQVCMRWPYGSYGFCAPGGCAQGCCWLPGLELLVPCGGRGRGQL